MRNYVVLTDSAVFLLLTFLRWVVYCARFCIELLALICLDCVVLHIYIYLALVY